MFERGHMWKTRIYAVNAVITVDWPGIGLFWRGWNAAFLLCEHIKGH